MLFDRRHWNGRFWHGLTLAEFLQEESEADLYTATLKDRA